MENNVKPAVYCHVRFKFQFAKDPNLFYQNYSGSSLKSILYAVAEIPTGMRNIENQN